MLGELKGDAANGAVMAGRRTELTAMSVYALLAMGESIQDPVIAAAVKRLIGAKIDDTATLAMRMNMLGALSGQDRKYRELAGADMKAMLQAMEKGGADAGMWRVSTTNAMSARSGAASFLAMDAMSAVVGAGVDVTADVWALPQKAWVSGQLPDGGWADLGGG